MASQILIESQFTGTVYNMLGGIVAWKAAGYPVKTLEPDLDASGTLTWNKIDPGALVQTEISIGNIGEAGSLLDWSIESYPEWGIWTFDPSFGDDLPIDDIFTVIVNVTAPEENGAEFIGDVKIVKNENTSDFIILPINLKTPRNKAMNNINLLRIFRIFPISFQIIKYLIRL